MLNFTSPGRTKRESDARYEAMRDALLAVLPEAVPGLKGPDAKAAQLGLEAPTKLVQLYPTNPGK
jgi:hypothetical protein